MRLHATGTLAVLGSERHIRCMASGGALGPWLVAACFMAGGMLLAGEVRAGQGATPGIELEQLLERFDGRPAATNGSVRLDAWIEPGPERDQVVVVVEPQGDFKLVADPGITVTPTAQPGVEWLVPLPHRLVDSESQYLAPPATVRLPFRAQGEAPLEILVEYAYCLVEYQCFFGEEVLRVAAQ
jgi:hypothetical protein